MRRLWMPVLLGLAACAAAAPPAGVEAVRADAEPLRAAFNAAHGKVRAIFIASPT